MVASSYCCLFTIHTSYIIIHNFLKEECFLPSPIFTQLLALRRA